MVRCCNCELLDLHPGVIAITPHESMRSDLYPGLNNDEIITSLEYQNRLNRIDVGSGRAGSRIFDIIRTSSPLRRQRTISRAHKRRRVQEHGVGEPAALSLDVVSCDGGQFDSEVEYGPSNMLLNDYSVYCSARNEANVIFRHVGDVAFCLSKIVIKAPSSGYTCPVRSGLIFVSMDSRDLISRTASFSQQLPQEEPEDGDDDDDDDEWDFQAPEEKSSPVEISADMDATQEESALRPHARFDFRPDTFRCEVNFDPLCSGRYILLKLFGSSRNSNIDVQSVLAYGYVGRRRFPSIKLR